MDAHDERNRTELRDREDFCGLTVSSVGHVFDDAVIPLPTTSVAAENAPPSAAAASAFAGVPAAARQQPVLFPGAPRSLPVPIVDPERFDKLRDLSLKDDEAEETITPPLSVRVALPAKAQQEPFSTLCRVADPSSLWNRERLAAELCANGLSAENVFPLQQMKPLNSYEARMRAADTEQLEQEFSRLAATSERFSFAAAPAGCSLPYSGLWHTASICTLEAGASRAPTEAVPPTPAAVGLDNWYATSAAATIAGAQRLLEALQQHQPPQQPQVSPLGAAAAAGAIGDTGRPERQQHPQYQRRQQREAAEEMIRRHLELLTADGGRVTRCCPRAAAFLLEQLRQAGADLCQEDEKSFFSSAATTGGGSQSAAEVAETRKRFLFSSVELLQQQPVTDRQELALLGSAPLFTEDERLDNLLLLLLTPGVAPEIALQAELPKPLQKPVQQEKRPHQLGLSQGHVDLCGYCDAADRSSRRYRSDTRVAEAAHSPGCDPSVERFAVEATQSLISRISRRLQQMEQQGNFRLSGWNSLLPPLQEQEPQKCRQHEQDILQGQEDESREDVGLLHRKVLSVWGSSRNGSESVTSARLAAARARLAYVALFGDERFLEGVLPCDGTASAARGIGRVQQRPEQAWVPPRQWVVAALGRLRQLLHEPDTAPGLPRIVRLQQEIEKEEARFAAAVAAVRAQAAAAEAEAASARRRQAQLQLQRLEQLQRKPPPSWKKMGFSARIAGGRRRSSLEAGEKQAAGRPTITETPTKPLSPEATAKESQLHLPTAFALMKNAPAPPVKKMPHEIRGPAGAAAELTQQLKSAKKLPPAVGAKKSLVRSRPSLSAPSEGAAQEKIAADAGTTAAGGGDAPSTPLAGSAPAPDGELQRQPLSFKSAAQHAAPKPASSSRAEDYVTGVKDAIEEKRGQVLFPKKTEEKFSTALESAYILQSVREELPAGTAVPFNAGPRQQGPRQQPMQQDGADWPSIEGGHLDIEKPVVLVSLAPPTPSSQTAATPASVDRGGKRGAVGAAVGGAAGDERAADEERSMASPFERARGLLRSREQSSRLRQIFQEPPETFDYPPAGEDGGTASYSRLLGSEGNGGRAATAAIDSDLFASPADVAATLKRIDYAAGGGYAFLQSSLDAAIPSSSARSGRGTSIGSIESTEGLGPPSVEAVQDSAEQQEEPLMSPTWGGSFWRLELAARARSAASAGRAVTAAAGRAARDRLFAAEGKPSEVEPEKQRHAGSVGGGAATGGVEEWTRRQGEDTDGSRSVFFASKAYTSSPSAAAEEKALEDRYAYPGALISPGYFQPDEFVDVQQRRQERKSEARQFISVEELKVREEQEEAERNRQRGARLAEAQKAALARGAAERKRREEAQARARQLRMEEKKRLKEEEESRQVKLREEEQRRLQLRKQKQERREMLQQQLNSSPADLAVLYRESRRRRGESHPLTRKMRQVLTRKLEIKKTAIKKPGVHHRRRTMTRAQSLTDEVRKREKAMRMAKQWAGRGEAALLMADVLRGEVAGRQEEEGEKEKELEEEGEKEEESEEEDFESESTEYTYPSLLLSTYGSSAESAAAPLGHPTPTTYIAYRPVPLRLPDLFLPRLAYSGVLLVEELPVADAAGEPKSSPVPPAARLLNSERPPDASAVPAKRNLAAEAGSAAAAAHAQRGSPARGGQTKHLLRQRMYAQMRGQGMFFFVDARANLPAKPAARGRDSGSPVKGNASEWTPTGNEDWKLLFGIVIDSTTVVEKVSAPNPYLPIRVAARYPAIRLAGALNINSLAVASEPSTASTASAAHTLAEDTNPFRPSPGGLSAPAATPLTSSGLAIPAALPSDGGSDSRGGTSLPPAVGPTAGAGSSGDARPPAAAEEQPAASLGSAGHPAEMDLSIDSTQEAADSLHTPEAYHGAAPPRSTVGGDIPLPGRAKAPPPRGGPQQQQKSAATRPAAAGPAAAAVTNGHKVWARANGPSHAGRSAGGASPLPKDGPAAVPAAPSKTPAPRIPHLQENVFSEAEQLLAQRKYVDMLLSADSLQEIKVWLSLLLRRVALSKYEQAFAAAVVAARKTHALEAADVKEQEVEETDEREEDVERKESTEAERDEEHEMTQHVFREQEEGHAAPQPAKEAAEEEGTSGVEGKRTAGGADSTARDAAEMGTEESSRGKVRAINGNGQGWQVAQSVADFCFSASEMVLSLKGMPYFKEADSVFFACLEQEQRVHVLDLSNRLLKDRDLREVKSLLPFQAHQVLLRANLLTAAAEPSSVRDLLARLNAATVDLSDNNYSSPRAGELLFSLLFKTPELHTIFLDRDRLEEAAVATFAEEVADCVPQRPVSSRKELSLSGNKLTTADVLSLLRLQHLRLLPQLALLNLSNNTPAIEEAAVRAYLRALRDGHESGKQGDSPSVGEPVKREQQQQREKGNSGGSAIPKSGEDTDEEEDQDRKGSSFDSSPRSSSSSVSSDKSDPTADGEDARRSSGESGAGKKPGSVTVPEPSQLNIGEKINLKVDFSLPQPPADGLVLPMAAGYADIEQMPVTMSGRLYAYGWKQSGTRLFPDKTVLAGTKKKFRKLAPQAKAKPPKQHQPQNDGTSPKVRANNDGAANAGYEQSKPTDNSQTAPKRDSPEAGTTSRSGGRVAAAMGKETRPRLVYFELRGSALVHYPLGVRDPSCWKEQGRKEDKPGKGWEYDLNLGQRSRTFRGIYLHHLWVDSHAEPMLLHVQGFDVDAAAAAALPPAAPLHLLQQNPLLPLITFTLRGISETATIEWARLLHARLAGICYVRTEQAAANLLSGSAIQFFQGCAGGCLDFRGCPVSPAALQASFAYLCKYTWLKHLNLCNTQLRGAHLAALGGGAFQLLQLEVLDLSFNCLTGEQEDADLLLQVFSFRGCRRLILDHNPIKGRPPFAKVLVRVACCMDVEVFAANACGLSDDFAEAVTQQLGIFKLEEQSSQQSMGGRGRKGGGTLHTLEIERNSFSSHGLQVLVDALTSAAPTLQVVKAYGNPLKHLFPGAKTVELQGTPKSGKPSRVDRRLQPTRSIRVADTSGGLQTAAEAAALRELFGGIEKTSLVRTTDKSTSLSLRERYGM